MFAAVARVKFQNVHKQKIAEADQKRSGRRGEEICTSNYIFKGGGSRVLSRNLFAGESLLPLCPKQRRSHIKYQSMLLCACRTTSVLMQFSCTCS